MASQLNDHDSAYKLSHLTATALLSIKNEVHLALAGDKAGKATSVVLVDQSAAFDTTDYTLPLDCVSSWFGVGGVVLDWFASYLLGPD